MGDDSGDSGSDDRANATRSDANPTPADPEPFSVPLDAVRPSQLYLNGRKLSLVTQWFDFSDPNHEPLPVRPVPHAGLDDEWMLTDGHTRAFVAYLSGADELRVVRDADDLRMDVYRRCVEWCRDEGVTGIADLTGRALNADEFEEQWVERCRELTDSE